MPENERPPPARHLSPHDWLDLLREGEIEVEGRMPWSSNATFLVNVRSPRGEGKAIYKPGAGERPLWDYPTGLFRREVAAYELSHALGLGVVPETVLRRGAPFGDGSLQRFVDADFSEHYFTLLERPELALQLRVIAGFDLLCNNADRKGGHLLIDGEGHCWGIDNGLCFHEEPKLRTVMWDFAGEAVPEPVLAGARTLCEDWPEPLTELLSPDELVALSLRAEELVTSAEFPEPDPDGRPYPWPLV